jgi:hypothetical protein
MVDLLYLRIVRFPADLMFRAFPNNPRRGNVIHHWQ